MDFDSGALTRGLPMITVACRSGVEGKVQALGWTTMLGFERQIHRADPVGSIERSSQRGENDRRAGVRRRGDSGVQGGEEKRGEEKQEK